MELYKYQGAGNDFLIGDNRNGEISLDAAMISHLCNRRYGIGADGVMLLEKSDNPLTGFKMEYFNSDGSGGMMCGNGGRCIAAFAHRCGIDNLNFIAADGMHHAEVLSSEGNTLTIKISMKDVTEMEFFDTPEFKGCFLDTGTRHFVVPVVGLGEFAVNELGKQLRYAPQFAPIGVNVNFIEKKDDILHVRTYEKGVEDETYACGTGITASAIAEWHYQHPQSNNLTGSPTHIQVKALRDMLAVDFVPTVTGARDIFLTGPATFVAKVII